MNRLIIITNSICLIFTVSIESRLTFFIFWKQVTWLFILASTYFLRVFDIRFFKSCSISNESNWKDEADWSRFRNAFLKASLNTNLRSWRCFFFVESSFNFSRSSYRLCSISVCFCLNRIYFVKYFISFEWEQVWLIM